jgi:uncharacterized protein (DUF608 family)
LRDAGKRAAYDATYARLQEKWSWYYQDLEEWLWYCRDREENARRAAAEAGQQPRERMLNAKRTNKIDFIISWPWARQRSNAVHT